MKILAMAALLLFAQSSFAQKPPTPAPNAADPTITYEKKQIKLDGKIIDVEIADTADRQRQGLMFRKSLASNAGMLFVFQYEEPRGFWMKNTLIPLAIGYFDANKKLVDIQEMVPAVMGTRDHLLKTYESAKPAMYALEMNKGWFAQNKVKVGSHFEFLK
ncbi:MAG TPA: DUF192 domain-containing protein [Bdellovibrionales bacterium]|nr:DUF192 domain-containing protein [Bdellovibrionales bacterium]